MPVLTDDAQRVLAPPAPPSPWAAGAPAARATAHPPAPGGRGGLELFAGWRALRRGDLSSHLAQHGAPPLPGPADRGWAERFVAVVRAAGLSGRGGAGFSSAAKLALVGASGEGATVVVNAVEGEPASAKDKALLSCVPHLVLDGAELVACALGASRIVVCVADDQPAVTAAVARAVAERVGTGLSPVAVDVGRAPSRYVTGEESALVSWLDGRRAAPTFRARKGVALTLGRRPALVHNAETLAHAALIARHGPAAFRAVGTADAPGTTLTTVTGAVRSPGVYEVPLGTPVIDVIGHASPIEAVAAVLTGGYGGAWLSSGALSTPYAPRAMAEAGGVLGAGILVVLPRSSCGVAESARIARYMADQSAAQCGPCVFGLPAIADDLAELARCGADDAVMTRLERRLRTVDGRGACRHPDGVVRMVRSALDVFAGHVAEHRSGCPCPLVARASVLPDATGPRR